MTVYAYHHLHNVHQFVPPKNLNLQNFVIIKTDYPFCFSRSLNFTSQKSFDPDQAFRGEESRDGGTPAKTTKTNK